MGIGKIVIGVWLAGAMVPVAAADHPYEAIVVRNVFGLKPPPDPEASKPPPVPPPKILLQGISTVLGKKQVAFEVEIPPKPPHTGAKTTMFLEEGAISDEIEVVAIDEIARAVTFKNHGETQVKTIEKDSARPVATAVPALATATGGTPAFTPRLTPTPTPGLQSIPTRTAKPIGTESRVPPPPPGSPQ